MSDDIDRDAAKLLVDGPGKRPLRDVLSDIAALDKRPHEPGCTSTVPLAIASCPCPLVRGRREGRMP